jgi:hypothetical protein
MRISVACNQIDDDEIETANYSRFNGHTVSIFALLRQVEAPLSITFTDNYHCRSMRRRLSTQSFAVFNNLLLLDYHRSRQPEFIERFSILLLRLIYWLHKRD